MILPKRLLGVVCGTDKSILGRVWGCCHSSMSSGTLCCCDPQCLGLSSKGYALWEGTSDEPLCTVEHLLASGRADSSPFSSNSFSCCSVESSGCIFRSRSNRCLHFHPLSIFYVESCVQIPSEFNFMSYMTPRKCGFMLSSAMLHLLQQIKVPGFGV